jgi:hypothetical protein
MLPNNTYFSVYQTENENAMEESHKHVFFNVSEFSDFFVPGRRKKRPGIIDFSTVPGIHPFYGNS